MSESVLDEVCRTPAILLAAELTELRARAARLERERDEAREQARKHEERGDFHHDAAQRMGKAWEASEAEARRIDEVLIVVTGERDRLRGQLAEVREAWKLFDSPEAGRLLPDLTLPPLVFRAALEKRAAALQAVRELLGGAP